MRSTGSRFRLAGLVLAIGVTAPAAAAGQSAPDPDFLFGRPDVILGIQGGWAVPTAGSEIFDFTTERLTLDDGDFAAFSVGGQLAWRASERLDVVLDLSHARSESPSEFTDWVGEDDLPIEQTTTLWRTPLTVGVRGYLFDRGREISRFAWVPTARWNLYAGAAAGSVWYSFRQEGEFVDFETLDIFPDVFVSEGSTATVHALGGVQLSLSRRFVLNLEGRHAWASAPMDQDFVDFDDIDLGGFSATVGVAARF